MLTEVTHAERDLADQRLTCGQHVIGFDPHSADGNESSFLDALQHAREQVWMFLFQPRILLGGTHRVREIRILVHQGKHVGHRAGHFTVGFTHGPQPCGIDMRMADRDMMDDAGICGFG